MPITALSILGLQLNYLGEEENKRKNVKVRRAATTKGTEQHRMTPIKTRSERKKGASIESYTMRLLSVRSRALEAAHLRKRQQLLSKRQEFPSEIGTHRLVRCIVPLTEVVLIP